MALAALHNTRVDYYQSGIFSQISPKQLRIIWLSDNLSNISKFLKAILGYFKKIFLHVLSTAAPVVRERMSDVFLTNRNRETSFPASQTDANLTVKNHGSKRTTILSTGTIIPIRSYCFCHELCDATPPQQRRSVLASSSAAPRVIWHRAYFLESSLPYFTCCM